MEMQRSEAGNSGNGFLYVRSMFLIATRTRIYLYMSKI